MSQPYGHTPTPATAADCSADWIAERRAIVLRDGHAIRAGRGPWIEVQSINRPDHWCTLTLPGNALVFATVTDRDTVLRQLWGYPS